MRKNPCPPPPGYQSNGPSLSVVRTLPVTMNPTVGTTRIQTPTQCVKSSTGIQRN